MERLLETLLAGAEPALTPRAVCGCDECLRARCDGDARGACRRQERRLRSFLAHRIRGRGTRGATALGRIAEDARRYARLMAAAARARLRLNEPAPLWGRERPLEQYAIESQS